MTCSHITVGKRSRIADPVDLVEYAQFFACYTETNREKSQFYWSADKGFKSFESLGGKHLDAYIVAPGSTFERLGVIPHALRGGGKVADTWHRPVLVGQPSPKGWRHIVLTEPAVTAGLASGMGGIAMDYIAYPGCRYFQARRILFDSYPAPYCQDARFNSGRFNRGTLGRRLRRISWNKIVVGSFSFSVGACIPIYRGRDFQIPTLVSL